METDRLIHRKETPRRTIVPSWLKLELKPKAKEPGKMPSIEQRKYLVGVLLLLSVVILWTFSSFITSDLLGGGFDKPFLITYLNTSSFAFYLLPSWLKRWRKRSRTEIEDRTEYEPIPTLPPSDNTPLRRSNSLIRSLSPSPVLNLHTQSPHASTLHPAHIPLPSIEEVPSSPQDMHYNRSSLEGTRGRRRPSEEHHSRLSRQLTTGDGPESGLGPVTHGPDGVVKLSSRETAKLAAVFCFAWFAANWSLNLSFRYTSVGSSTVLAGMSGFFTLGLGRLIGVETFSRAKVLAVLASFVGLVLVTQSDSRLATSSISPDILGALDRASPTIYNGSLPVFPYASSSPDADKFGLALLVTDPRNPLLGDMMALLSAGFYSFYCILLKVRIGDEENIDMQLFFGFVGLFNTISLLPLIPILHFTGIEPFEIPSRGADLAVCGINMLITLSSDYIYVLAMLRTSPLVVTVGLSLTIPFAMLGDFLRGSTSTITIESLFGATCVIAGFLLMGAEGWEEGMNPRTGEAEIVAAEFALEHEEGSGDEDEESVRVSIDGKGKQRQVEV